MGYAISIRVFVVPIEPDKDIYAELPIYERIQLLMVDYLYEIQMKELENYKCII
jgi:hypothetical protein